MSRVSKLLGEIKTHKQYDDEEDQEIAKAIIGQRKALQKINASIQKALEDAKEYDKWLVNDAIQALLSPENKKISDEIHDKLKQIEGIV